MTPTSLYNYISLTTTGGFSQGGHLALHAAYQSSRVPVRAVFALGSFLAQSSAVFQSEEAGPLPPLFLSHGSEDAMVSPGWVTQTRDKLAGGSQS